MTTTTQRRRFAATAALILIGAALTACASTETYGEHDAAVALPSGASVQTLPPLPAPWTELDRTDPDAVALAAVNALFDWRPDDGDTGPESARDRAHPLLTPRAATTYRPYPIPRPVWESWMNNHTALSTTSQVSSEQHPTDTDLTRSRKYITRIHAVSGEDISATTLVTVTKQPMWTVTAVTTLPS